MNPRCIDRLFYRLFDPDVPSDGLEKKSLG